MREALYKLRSNPRTLRVRRVERDALQAVRDGVRDLLALQAGHRSVAVENKLEARVLFLVDAVERLGIVVDRGSVISLSKLLISSLFQRRGVHFLGRMSKSGAAC